MQYGAYLSELRDSIPCFLTGLFSQSQNVDQ